MLVTVSTDASFSFKAKIGTFAFWITSNDGRIKHSGVLKGECHTSTEAEMKCICNALFSLAINEGLSRKTSKIIINTDSMNAIHVFTGDQKLIKKYKLDSNRYRMFANKYRKITSMVPHAQIEFRHIKAHQKIESPRGYVNFWCDQEAKKQIEKIVGPRS